MTAFTNSRRADAHPALGTVESEAEVLKFGVRTPINCCEAGEQTGISSGRDLTWRSPCAILVSSYSDFVKRLVDHQDRDLPSKEGGPFFVTYLSPCAAACAAAWAAGGFGLQTVPRLRGLSALLPVLPGGDGQSFPKAHCRTCTSLLLHRQAK
jgi:hypothetical protein